MTIGTILPEVLAECGIDVPVPDINENSFQMRQVASIMNAAGRDIGRRVEWARLSASVTGASLSLMALPADFHKMADRGAVVLGGYEYTPARPVTSPELWQLLEQFPPAQQYYHLKDGNVLFAPAIGSGGVTIRYVSKNWLGASDRIASNADTPVFPEHLLARATIWRWRRQKGLPYDDLSAEFDAALEEAARADRGA